MHPGYQTDRWAEGCIAAPWRIALAHELSAAWRCSHVSAAYAAWIRTAA